MYKDPWDRQHCPQYHILTLSGGCGHCALIAGQESSIWLAEFHKGSVRKKIKRSTPAKSQIRALTIVNKYWENCENKK